MNQKTALLVILITVAQLALNTLNADGLTIEQRATIQLELEEPIKVTLKNGRSLSGHATDVSTESLQLSLAEGAGEITFTISRNDISEIELPGEHYKSLAVERLESGDTTGALEIMDYLYQQRSLLLPALEATESHFFIYYIDLILASPKPARAVAVAKRLAPQITNPDAVRALEDTTLESYNTLQLHDEAVPLAEAWVADRTPFYKSALGYYVLGASKLRSKDYAAALDIALQPIVFSTPKPQENLAHCYAVAISAALGLREKEYALTLHSEMKERDLLWPEGDTMFDPFFKQIQKESQPSDEQI